MASHGRMHASDVVYKRATISIASLVTRAFLLTLQASQLFSRLRQMEPEEFRELAAILRILMNPQLDVLAEGFVGLALLGDILRILFCCSRVVER